MPDQLLTVTELAKSFGSRTLWSGLTFSVDGGQLCALTGRSGAGKSTMLNCLGLLESADGGQILVDGADITRFRRGAARRFRRDVLGYLFQNYALIENTTVRDNLDVALPGRHKRSGRMGYEQALDHVGMAGRFDEPVYRLSGGEQQRIALARLLVKQPSLVLADEPTGALDDDNAAMVIDTLRSMADNGCAVVIATHLDRIRQSCDTIVAV